MDEVIKALEALCVSLEKKQDWTLSKEAELIKMMLQKLKEKEEATDV